jgi:hypothetical protein
MAKASDPRRANRYRDLSQLLDNAAEELERQKKIQHWPNGD